MHTNIIIQYTILIIIIIAIIIITIKKIHRIKNQSSSGNSIFCSGCSIKNSCKKSTKINSKKHCKGIAENKK